MKRIIILLTLLCGTVLVQAQVQGTCAQKISLYNTECNRAWTYNDLRFYKLLWEGMKQGELKTYAEDGDAVKIVSFSDVYDYYQQSKQIEYGYEDYFDGPVIAKTKADSLEALRPCSFEIYSEYNGNTDTIRLERRWFHAEGCLNDVEFGYTFSYPELIEFLNKKKCYWVNPYQDGDSVLFSTALQEERFVFEWRGESSDVKFYNTELYSNKAISDKGYKFNGNLIRYANVRDYANRPYSDKRPQGEVISVLMSAYLSGKLKGYDPYSGLQPVLYTPDMYRMRVINNIGEEYYIGEEEVQEIPYAQYDDLLDMISVSYHVNTNSLLKPSNSFVKEEPYLFTIAISAENNYRGLIVPFISFNYSEAISVLEASGLMWYAFDNHADSCSIATAIQRNNVYWNTACLTDPLGGVIYSCRYDKDSIKMRFDSENPDACIQKVIDYTIKGVDVKMNTKYANANIPARSLALYLHYWGTRSLDKTEDSTLTFLKDLSAYLVNKALEGKVSIYKTDSLNVKLSKEEFASRMRISGYIYDAEGNETEGFYTLNPDDFYVSSVQTDFIVNKKGKLILKDRSVQLRIPIDFSIKGLEMPLASFSYDELSALMKKDKQGKALLKQLDATRQQGTYKLLLDAYGYELYDFWGFKSKEEQLKNVYPAIQPYLQK